MSTPSVPNNKNRGHPAALVGSMLASTLLELLLRRSSPTRDEQQRQRAEGREISAAHQSKRQSGYLFICSSSKLFVRCGQLVLDFLRSASCYTSVTSVTN